MAIYFLVDRDDGDQVKVDMDMVSCSCRDFKKNRKTYGYSDPRRRCKHLAEAFSIEQLILPADAARAME